MCELKSSTSDSANRPKGAQREKCGDVKIRVFVAKKN